MFRRILIANRGEVAARVLKTCDRLGIETVALATDADSNLAFLQTATTVAGIGPSRAYLDIDAVIEAGRANGVSAVHPGWGFLSGNPTFAARCEASGISFVGPSSSTMRRMADKAVARTTMGDLGLPTIPGSDGVVGSVAHAKTVAESLGYPVLLKAVSGGGGRGMRIVRTAAEVGDAFTEASAEAQSAFGDGRMYMEKLVEGARHIEFQVMADRHEVHVLGERECSIQRRHQKLLEETPSPGLQGEAGSRLRDTVIERIKAACKALNYRGAGTIEMLYDPSGHLYFMEMNTRLQVEHTVTEMVTGVDLVEAQLEVAANRTVGPFEPANGWSIQCRINAEDATDGFRPQPGLLTRFEVPTGEGIRVDTHLQEGDAVSPHYDSMIAKVIATGADRPAAIARMRLALSSFRVEGVPTTIDFHRRLLDHPEFIAGNTDTGFLERKLKELLG